MTTHTTKTGRTLTDADFDAIADEVESAEYDVEALKTRRRGRPAMDSGRGVEGAPVGVAAVGVEFLGENTAKCLGEQPPNPWKDGLQIPSSSPDSREARPACRVDCRDAEACAHGKWSEDGEDGGVA